MPEIQPPTTGTAGALSPEDAAIRMNQLLEAEEALEAGPPEEPEEPPEESAEEEPPVEEGGEPAAQAPVTVKVGDEELTVDQLKAGYLRHQDYTRKTTETAEQRRALENERAYVAQEHQRYAALLPKMEEALQNLVPDSDTNWEKVRDEDPAGFAERFAAHQLAVSRVEKARAEKERVQREQQEEYVRQMSVHLQEERGKLLASIPEWEDRAKADAEMEELRQYAMKQGFPPETLASVTDHRAVLLLRKAMLWDKHSAARSAAKQKVAPSITATPGSPATRAPQPTTAYVRAKERAAKSGSVKDAAVALERLMGAMEGARRRP